MRVEPPNENPCTRVPVEPMPAASCVTHTFLSSPAYVKVARSTAADDQPSRAAVVRPPPPMHPAATTEHIDEKAMNKSKCAEPEVTDTIAVMKGEILSKRGLDFWITIWGMGLRTTVR